MSNFYAHTCCLVQGFYSSVRPTVNQLSVNVNVCYTAFYKTQNLAQAIKEFRTGSFGGHIDKYIEGVRVTPTHVSLRFYSTINKRIMSQKLSYRPKKTVRSVSRQGARDKRFQCQELGGMVTVEKYFERSKHNFLFPGQPVLISIFARV